MRHRKKTVEELMEENKSSNGDWTDVPDIDALLESIRDGKRPHENPQDVPAGDG